MFEKGIASFVFPHLDFLTWISSFGLAAEASGCAPIASDNLLRIVNYLITFEFICGIISEAAYLEKLPLLYSII